MGMRPGKGGSNSAWGTTATGQQPTRSSDSKSASSLLLRGGLTSGPWATQGAGFSASSRASFL